MKKLTSILFIAFLLFFIPAFAQGNRSISIEAVQTVVYTGKRIALTATVKNLTEQTPSKTTFVWTSSDKGVAKVDGKGTVTGISAGTATITCQAKDDKSISTSVQIEVRAAVKTLTLADKRVTLLLGAGEEKAQFKLPYTILPEDAYEKTVSWSSSDEAVATVDANGIVHAVGSGKAVISVKSNDPAMARAATCAVTVGQAARIIKLSEYSATIEKRKKLKLSASILPGDALNTSVVWTSSNEEIVKVDARGTISAMGTGTATVTCTAKDGSGVSNTCKITVVQNVTKISSKTKRLVLFEDETYRAFVSVSPLDATNKAVKWTSSNSYIASVDSNGTVTAEHAGEAVITATAADGDGKKYSFKVIVEPASPISLESIGFGVYLPNLLGLTVKNKCKTKTITDFNFDMELYSYDGSTIDKGSYSLGTATSVGAKGTKTIRRTVSGAGYAMKVVITITGVTFSDGSYYPIPGSLQETWTFRR